MGPLGRASPRWGQGAVRPSVRVLSAGGWPRALCLGVCRAGTNIRVPTGPTRVPLPGAPLWGFSGACGRTRTGAVSPWNFSVGRCAGRQRGQRCRESLKGSRRGSAPWGLAGLSRRGPLCGAGLGTGAGWRLLRGHSWHRAGVLPRAHAPGSVAPLCPPPHQYCPFRCLPRSSEQPAWRSSDLAKV